MAALITGLGYVGSALALRLLQAGEQVIGVENFFSTPKDALEPLRSHPGFTLIEGSVADPDVVKRALESATVDVLFHLAAQASAQPDAASIEVTCVTNFEGTRGLLAACVDGGVSRVVLASSMRLYATPLPPRVTEQDPVRTSDLVHLSQLFGEVLLAEYDRRRGAPWRAVAARMGIVHGVSPVMKQDPGFLAVPQRFCWQAVRQEPLRVATGPDTFLAFVHVDDAVDALLRCGELEMPLTIANVATEVRSVAHVAESVRMQGASRGLDVRLAPPQAPFPERSIRVESSLGHLVAAPERRLRASMGEVLDYYLAHCSPAQAG
jgi:nucleoside-diphosphate-sugar epimerase